MKELVDLLRVADLLLHILVLVARNLLGNWRGKNLATNLHQFTSGEVILQDPFIGSALLIGSF